VSGPLLAAIHARAAARRLLLVVAAPAEARAVLLGLGADSNLADRPWVLHRASDAVDVVVCGVGKANAAGAVGRFADPVSHGAVLNVGVAGALPGAPAGLRDVVAATRSVYADEGLLTPAGYKDCAAMGFPLGPFEGAGPRTPDWIVDALRAAANHAGPIATVSTCSGTDSGAATVRERTGAIAEAMEGAAAAHAASRLGLPAGELRVISNTTGDRGRQAWDLPGALRALAGVIGRVV
jgi:futalosine hydrolase